HRGDGPPGGRGPGTGRAGPLVCRTDAGGGGGVRGISGGVRPMSRWRDVMKSLARGAATVVVVPELLSYHVRSTFLGRGRALEGSSQYLARIPGLTGQYLRRAFLMRVLDHFHPSAVVEFGTIFSQARARIEENAYVGP